MTKRPTSGKDDTRPDRQTGQTGENRHEHDHRPRPAATSAPAAGWSDMEAASLPGDEWSALSDQAGSRDADRRRFLVVGDTHALLALLRDLGGTWVEGTPVESSTHGTLRVWNGTDLNGQQHQLLLAEPVRQTGR